MKPGLRELIGKLNFQKAKQSQVGWVDEFYVLSSLLKDL